MKLDILKLKLKHLGMFNDNFFAKLEEENKEQESMRIQLQLIHDAQD